MVNVGKFLLARNGHAAAVAFLLGLLPLVGFPGGFFASVIVGLVTLCRGPRSGLFVLAWVALPAIALLSLGRLGVSDLLLLRCVLVWLLAWVLAHFVTWRSVFEVATLLGILTVVGVHLVHPDVHGWWQAHIDRYLQEVSRITSWQLTTDQHSRLVRTVVPMATGIVTVVLLFGCWLNVLLARWWQATLYFPGRLTKEFIAVRHRKVVALVVVLGALGFWSKQAIMVDLLPVLLFPMMMGGLSLLHYVATINKAWVVVVVLFYLGLLFLPFVVAILLAIVGFIDTWIDGRRLLKLKRSAL